MKSTVLSAAVVFFAISSLPSLSAQNVLINEIRADANGRWVELHNRSNVVIDLSGWSLHYGSHTSGMAQEYWWPFPAGATLPASGFLRVHWFQQLTGAPVANEYWTGTTASNFLFGLGGESLSGTRGALGLYRSKLAEAMSSPLQIEDWISWGEHGFSRESYAIDAGRWSAGRHAMSIAPGSSLARNGATIGVVPFHDQQWLVDWTPTPLQSNVSGASAVSDGAGCGVFGHHLLGQPVLRAPTLPTQGNAQFGLAIDNTTGIFGEYVLLAWSAAAAPAGQLSLLPTVPGGCSETIDTNVLVALWLAPAQIVSTFAPLSLATLPPTLIGSELHAQAIVLDLTPYAWSPIQGVSNALHVTFGS